MRVSYRLGALLVLALQHFMQSASAFLTSRLLADASLSTLEAAKLELQCRDLRAECPSIPPGECQRNPGYMLHHCALSCQSCDQEKLQGEARETLLYSLRTAVLALPAASPKIFALSSVGKDAVDVLELLHQQLRDVPENVPLPLGKDPSLFSFFADVERETEGQFDFRPANLEARTTAKLADGYRMPLLGFGTWQLTGAAGEEAVLHALSVGYRHIDGAENYNNDAEIGRAVRRSGVPREELFIVNKLSKSWGAAARGAVLQQLEQMGVDYFDLYMLHGPHQDHSIMRETWAILEQLVDEGKIRSLGVSNFDEQQMDAVLHFSKKRLAYVQNKLSPFRPGHQGNPRGSDLLRYARHNGIMFVGYSAVNAWPGRLNPLHDLILRRLADLKLVSVAQLLNRWVLQLGAAVIPRSSNKARIEQNSKLFHFHLTTQEMAVISGLQWLVHDSNNKPFFPNIFSVAKITPGPVDVIFRNDVGHSVKMAWLSDEGREIDLGEVPHGEDFSQLTVTGHVFGFRDSRSGASPQLFRSYRVGQEQNLDELMGDKHLILMSSFLEDTKLEL